MSNRQKRERQPIDAAASLIFWSVAGAIVITVILGIPATRAITRFPPAVLFSLSQVPQIILLTIVLMAFLFAFRRTGLILTIFVTLAGVMSAANWQKISVLGQPIVFEDFAFLENPSIFLSAVDPTLFVVVGLVATVGGFLGIRLDRRLAWIHSTLAISRRGMTGVRIFFVVFMAGLFVSATTFHHSYNPLRNFYTATGAVWAPWDPLANNLRNGFVGSWLFSLPVDPMEEPANYGRVRIDELTSAITREFESEQPGGSLLDWNVIVVLSESFGDPLLLDEIELERDPLREFRELQDEYLGGNMQAVAFGTGTSTMEYQVLTGQSVGILSPQVISPYQAFVSDQSEFPSLARWWSDNGNESLAVHGWRGSMYDRDEVYPALGFGDFVDLDEMNDRGIADPVEGQRFVRDDVHFDIAFDAIQKSKDPVLAHVVTMQNHGPYDSTYDSEIEVSGSSDADKRERMQTWVTGLESSARQLGTFLSDLEQLDEPTAVVYFGDHFPSIDSDAVASIQPSAVTSKTPYLLWDNKGVLKGSSVSLPTVISPTSLIPLLSRGLDASGPPIFDYLMELQENVGAVTRRGIVDSDGDFTTFDDLPDSDRELIDEYRSIQFDLAYGRHYSVEALWPGSRVRADDS